MRLPFLSKVKAYKKFLQTKERNFSFNKFPPNNSFCSRDNLQTLGNWQALQAFAFIRACKIMPDIGVVSALN